MTGSGNSGQKAGTLIHRSGRILTCAMSAAWAAVPVQLLTRILDNQTFIALLAGAVALSVHVGLIRHSARMELASTAHADRMQALLEGHADHMEALMKEHTKAMTDHVLTVERFFTMGIKGQVLASVDVADSRAEQDSGSFRVYNGHH